MRTIRVPMNLRLPLLVFNALIMPAWLLAGSPNQEAVQVQGTTNEASRQAGLKALHDIRKRENILSSLGYRRNGNPYQERFTSVMEATMDSAAPRQVSTVKGIGAERGAMGLVSGLRR